jgi:hypothetical protein
MAVFREDYFIPWDAIYLNIENNLSGDDVYDWYYCMEEFDMKISYGMWIRGWRPSINA